MAFITSAFLVDAGRAAIPASRGVGGELVGIERHLGSPDMSWALDCLIRFNYTISKNYDHAHHPIPIERDNAMTESPPSEVAAKPGMHDLSDVASLVEIQPEATVSRTILQAEGARVVLFSFTAGQGLTAHNGGVH